MSKPPPTERDNTPRYIARTTKPTKRHPVVGTIVCVTVDENARIKETAKDVSKWLRAGLTIERAPVWWVRLYLFTAEVYRAEPSNPKELT